MLYKGDDYDKVYEALSKLKNKNLKVNNTLMEKYKDIIENPEFEQNHYSRTALVFTKLDMIVLEY